MWIRECMKIQMLLWRRCQTKAPDQDYVSIKMYFQSTIPLSKNIFFSSENCQKIKNRHLHLLKKSMFSQILIRAKICTCSR